MKKLVYVSLVSIGDEILYGQTLNTNAHWLAKALSDLSFKILEMITISDAPKAITSTIDRLMKSSHLVILTGGLGPTKDDLTKKTLADYFGVDLYFDQSIYVHLKSIFSAKNRDLNDLNKAQAYMPKNCTVLPNAVGTASGMYFEHNKKILIALPGVPYEMKYLFEKQVKTKIMDYFSRPYLEHKFFKIIGLPESILAQKLNDFENNLPKNVKLAYLPKINEIDLRFTIISDQNKTIQRIYNYLHDELYRLINKYIFDNSDNNVIKYISEHLIQANKTVSIAESCTGGYIAHQFTSVPGASAFFKGSITAYSNKIKEDILDIDNESISKWGAVSKEVVLEMAKCACQKFKTDYALATTGIMGPEGGTSEKPIGTVWVAIVDSKGHFFAKQIRSYYGIRTKNIHSTYIQTMKFFKDFI